MSVPIINILSQTLSIYMQGEYPELSPGEIDNVSRMALANLLNDDEFEEVMCKVISNTLQEYVDNRPEPEVVRDLAEDAVNKDIENCPLGGDISDDCDGCVYSEDYHFIDGECKEREVK